MTDALGFTPDDTGFWPINNATWIYVGEGVGIHLYQKIADNCLVPVVVGSSQYIPIRSYSQWVEQVTGKAYSDVLKQYEGVAG